MSQLRLLECMMIFYVSISILEYAQPLKIHIKTTKHIYSRTENVNVILQYENDDPESVYIRPAFLPYDGLYEPIFKVFYNAMRVEYIGRVAKRPADTIDNCIELLAGKNVSTIVDISNDYYLKETGTYKITLNGNVKSVVFETVHKTNSDNKSETRNLEIVTLVEGRHYISRNEPVLSINATQGRILDGYRGCSIVRQDLIRQAFSLATAYTNNAVEYLARSSSRSRYVTWFGRYSLSRWRIVNSNFQRISRSLRNNRYIIDCSCTNGGIYGYVFPNYPFNIYVCGLFWSSAMGGLDSKAGTLIHEASHFSKIVGTDDIAYGQVSCRNLARNYPIQTLRNADSYEYFAENI